MSRTFYFGNVAKRKNSTKQGSTTDFATSFDVLFKTPCSLDNPTLKLNYSGDFNFNVAKYGNNYYFVKDKVSLNNDLWEVTLELDALATHKSEILASTQFVAYSSVSGGTWLADTRIPILKNSNVVANSSSMKFLFSDGGFYVLSVVGKDGCDLWACDKSHLTALLNKINDWSDDLIDDIMAGNYPWSSNPLATYDFSTTEAAIESMATMNMLTGFAGNAYSAAPDCIRSCIWVPFFPTHFTDTGGEIYLGQFATDVRPFKCKATPAKGSVSINIPWQHNDWRRAVCEEVYLYIPLVGMVNIPSDEITNELAITIEWSATATDGCIAYRVTAGSQVIGTYGANASVNYPLGISQQASAGEIVQTAFAGASRTVSAGLSAVSTNPIQIAGGIASAGITAIDAAYQTVDAAMTRHNSCIGGIGGGAGVGLDLECTCFTVNHDTVIFPSQMQTTMGLPTQKPMLLSSLTVYCQCVNAHVALDADSPIMDAVDYYLNSGFYIE